MVVSTWAWPNSSWTVHVPAVPPRGGSQRRGGRRGASTCFRHAGPGPAASRTARWITDSCKWCRFKNTPIARGSTSPGVRAREEVIPTPNRTAAPSPYLPRANDFRPMPHPLRGAATAQIKRPGARRFGGKRGDGSPCWAGAEQDARAESVRRKSDGAAGPFSRRETAGGPLILTPRRAEDFRPRFNTDQPPRRPRLTSLRCRRKLGEQYRAVADLHLEGRPALPPVQELWPSPPTALLQPCPLPSASPWAESGSTMPPGRLFPRLPNALTTILSFQRYGPFMLSFS